MRLLVIIYIAFIGLGLPDGMACNLCRPSITVFLW